MKLSALIISIFITSFAILPDMGVAQEAYVIGWEHFLWACFFIYCAIYTTLHSCFDEREGSG